MARMARESECDAGPVGAVAQLGERLVRNEEVSGSIPLSSTKVSVTYKENQGTIRRQKAAKEQ